MDWDVDLIRRALEGMVDRALHNMGEPPFPFLREIRIWEEPHYYLCHMMELRFTNDTAVGSRLDYAAHEERRRFCVQDRVDFPTIEAMARELYIRRVRDRTIHFRVERARERGAIRSTNDWNAYNTDAHREAERWTQAAYSYRDQRRAMSHSFPAPRRPVQRATFDRELYEAQRRLRERLQERLDFERDPYARPDAIQWIEASVNDLLRQYPHLRNEVPPPAVPVTGIMDAHNKGRELLWNNITEAQKISLKTRGYFEVIGNRSGHTYRIYHGTQQNVVKLPGPMPRPRPIQRDYRPGGRFGWLNPFRLEETPIDLWARERELYSQPDPRGLCFVYEGLVPGDVMLGQKLSIETEEEEVAKVALFFGSASLGLLTWDCAGKAADYWRDMPCAPPATAMGA